MDFKEIIANYQEIVLKKYFCFEGRASRKSFWLFVLANFVISFVLGLIPGVGRLLSGIYSLAVLLPSLGLGARRMHDIGKSGWFLLINLIPFVGVIIFILLCCKPGIEEAGDAA